MRRQKFVNVEVCLLGLLFLLNSSAQTAAPADPDINTDRPAIANSSVVVPQGSLQFENGLTWTLNHGVRTLDIPESSVRLGLTNKTEFRFGVPDFFNSGPNPFSAAGFSDLSLGVKQQLGPIAGVDVSAIVAVSLPVGAKAFSSGGYDPCIQFPWSKGLPGGWSVGGMQSVFWTTVDGRRNRDWQPTFFVDRTLAKPWDVFAEYAGDYLQRGGSRQVIHFGSSLKIATKQQVDFHFGFGLNHVTPNHFFAAGYSFRVDHLFARR